MDEMKRIVWMLAAVMGLMAQSSRPPSGAVGPTVTPYVLDGGGAKVNNNCAKWSNGALVDAGAACGSGGSGGVADPGSNGLVARTGSGTAAARTLTAGSSKLTVTNGNGVSGNPTVDLGTLTAADLPAVTVRTDQSNTYSGGDQDFGAAVALELPTASLGTTAGRIRYNGATGRIEWYDAVGGATRAALFLPSGTGFIRSNGTVLSATSVPVPVALTSSTGVSASSTQFFGNAGLAPSATETTRQVPAPRSGSVTEMYCTTSGANGASGAYVMTLRINAASTAVVVTVPISGAQGTYSSTGNNVAVTAGDRLTVQANNSLTAATAPVAACQVVIMATQ